MTSQEVIIKKETSNNESVMKVKRTRKPPIKFSEFQFDGLIKTEKTSSAIKSENEECDLDEKSDSEINDDDAKLMPIKSRKPRKFERIFTCDKCKKTFKYEKTFKLHVNASSCTVFVCETCGKSFKKQSQLKIHQIREKGKKNQACSDCDYRSTTISDLRNHQARCHGSQSKFVCHICGKITRTEARLNNHINYTHLREKEFECKDCDFKTFNPECLRRHSNLKHKNAELFKCPVCSVVVKHTNTFKVHMRIHLNDRPFTCQTCKKTFHSSSHLAAHRRVHGSATFTCDECKRSFKTRGHLIRHQIIHTNQKPFSCKHCSYSCNVSTNLRKHLKLVHHIFDLDSEKASNSEVTDDVETPESKRGTEYADKFMKAYSEKTEQEFTIDILKRKQKANKEKQLEDLERVKNSLILKKCSRSNSNKVVDPRNDSERSVLVHKDNSNVIAVDEATRSIISLSPIPDKGVKHSLADFANLAQGTIIQFDEMTGQILHISEGGSILSGTTEENNTQIVLAGGATLQLRTDNEETNTHISEGGSILSGTTEENNTQIVLAGGATLQLRTDNEETNTQLIVDSSSNCSILNKGDDDQAETAKDDAPQIVFIVNDDMLS